MSTLSATIQADTSGFNAAIEKAEKELKQFDKTNKNLTDTIKKNNVVTDQQVKSFRNSISAMQKATSGANDYKQASSKLSKEIEKMKILYQSLNKEAQQGFFGTTLLKQIQATEAKVQQFNTSIDKTKMSVTSLNRNLSFKDMLSQVTGMVTPLNNVSSLVGKLGPAAATAAGSFTLIKDAILESETSMDRMNGIVEGFKNVYSELLRMLRGESSNILGGFSLGMASYNASDALGTFLSLNAGWKAKLEEQAASLKLKKAEGNIISNEEFNKVKKGINAYYNKLIKYVKDQQQAKINQLIGGGSPFMKALVGGFVAAGDKDFYLNERKTSLKTLEDERVGWAKDYIKSNPFYNIEDAKALYPKNAEIKDLQRFINAESTLLAPIAAIQADLNKADKERAQVLKELQEVVSKEKTGSTTKNNTISGIKYLEGSIGNLEKQINELDKKIKVTTDEATRKSLQDKYKELQYRLAKLLLPNVATIKTINRDMMLDIYRVFNEEIEGSPAFLGRLLGLNEKYRSRYLPEDWIGIYAVPKNIQDKIDNLYKNLYTNYTIGTEAFEKGYQKLNEEIKRLAEKAKEQYWWAGNTEDIYQDILKYTADQPNNEPSFRRGNSELVPMKPNVDVLNKHLKQLTITTSAVNNLASAWNNLWSVIDLGNDTINSTMQALGSSVQNFANMFVNLAEIQVAASQAEALGKGTASAAGLPFPYNLAAMATVIATVTSMFASFASIGKFAEGGIVGGNRSIGDYNIARVNSGEMILNGSQQKRLFHLLNSNGTAESSVQKVELVVRGKDLVGAIDNYNRQINRVR